MTARGFLLRAMAGSRAVPTRSPRRTSSRPPTPPAARARPTIRRSTKSSRAKLGSAGDHDWYRVNLVAGQTYTFALVGTGINDLRDPQLFLRDGSGNLITSNDDGGPGLSSTITYTATATGTYYLDAAAWNNSGSGQYGLSITQGNRAHYDVAMGGGAVDADFSWSATPSTGATVNYGFRQIAPPYSVQGSSTQTTFSQLTAEEIAAAQLALQLWSDVANITFTQVNPGGYTDNATILFSNYSDPNDGAGAFAFYPGSTASNSDCVFASRRIVLTKFSPRAEKIQLDRRMTCAFCRCRTPSHRRACCGRKHRADAADRLPALAFGFPRRGRNRSKDEPGERQLVRRPRRRSRPRSH
jgi:Bacterial pre-peptidase C-terminal domain